MTERVVIHLAYIAGLCADVNEIYRNDIFQLDAKADVLCPRVGRRGDADGTMARDGYAAL
jgi:hypothetical protein